MNPVQLNIFSSRLSSVCELMGVVLKRTAFSPNIKDRLDYSCALFDWQGKLLSQAAHIPVHLGSMAFAMADIIDRFEWAPGDMLVFNDPFLGGTHLPDVTVVSPVFLDNSKLVAFVANRAHHANIGARAPGSMPVSSSLEEEGVLISPCFLKRRSGWVESTLDMLQMIDSDSVKGSDQKIATLHGDFSAQVSANEQGVERMSGLLTQWGESFFEEGVRTLNDYAESLARQRIEQIPDGIYRYGDVMDSDGFGARNLPMNVQICVAGSDVVVDFAGTAKQVIGNVNCPLSVTAAAVYYVFYCLLPRQTPACSGAFRFLNIEATRGSLVHAQGPAAVAAGNVETSMRIVDVVLGALSHAIPEQIPANSQGTMNNVAMGGRSGGASWNYYETLGGGHGASSKGDGLSAAQAHMTNTLNTPVESVEMHYPLRVEQYALRRGSGGKGTHVGGDGLVRSYRFLADAEVNLLTERRSNAPKGKGGGDGMVGANCLNGASVDDKVQLCVDDGDLLTIKTPGGGGWRISE